MKILIVFALLVALVQSSRKYNGDKVYRVTPQDAEELKGLKELFDDFGSKIRFWKQPTVPGRDVDLHVNQHDTATVEDFLSKKAIKSKVMIENLQERIDDQLMSMKMKNKRSTGYTYDEYHTWDEIKAEINNLAENYDRATLFNVGPTYENNDMIGIKVSNGDGLIRPAIWVDGGIHSREWISQATVMYFLNRMVTSNCTDVTFALEKYDFYIMPVFNVDGYIYTYSAEGDRMWRKTRRPVGNDCVGVDPNRNWDNHFGGEGTSNTDPCSDDYCGEEAFSEIEVRNVAEYLVSIPGLMAYFNLHAYSQLLLTPFSYTNESVPNDFDEIMRVGEVFCQAVSDRYGTEYIVGPPSIILYPASGCTIDYTYENLGVVYSYGMELRDQGEYGFLLPEDQIIPTAQETSDAILTAALQFKVLNL